MTLTSTFNDLIGNAGIDLGGVILIIAVLGSLMFFTQNHKFGLLMTLVLLLIAFFLQKVLLLQTAITILLMVVVIVIMAITLYLSEKNSQASYG